MFIPRGAVMRRKHVWSGVTGLVSLTLAVAALAAPADAAWEWKISVMNSGANCPKATKPGVAASCRAFIDWRLDHPQYPPPQPTGTVKFSSFRGSVSPTSCDAALVSCTISYTPRGAGSALRKDTIQLSYSGDSVWYPKRTSVTIAVPVKLPVDFNLCTPPSTEPGETVQCSAQVEPGTAYSPNPQPTGTVHFSVSSTKGTVTPTTCVINFNSCAFTYTPKGTGTPWRKDVVTATYSGDADWTSARKTVVFQVRAP
jgi:hypothetical protein